MSPLINMWASWTANGGVRKVGQIMDIRYGKFGYYALVLDDSRLHNVNTDNIVITKDRPSLNGPYR